MEEKPNYETERHFYRIMQAWGQTLEYLKAKRPDLYNVFLPREKEVRDMVAKSASAGSEEEMMAIFEPMLKKDPPSLNLLLLYPAILMAQHKSNLGRKVRHLLTRFAKQLILADGIEILPLSYSLLGVKAVIRDPRMSAEIKEKVKREFSGLFPKNEASMRAELEVYLASVKETEEEKSLP